MAHRLEAKTINITNEGYIFFFLCFYFYLHSYFHEVLLRDLSGLQGSSVTLPLKLCNEVSEPAIIPRGSQCSKIPFFPPPSTMKT